MDSHFQTQLDAYATTLSRLQGHPFFKTAALQSATAVANLMDTLLMADAREDPSALLCGLFTRHTAYLRDILDAKAAFKDADAPSCGTPPDDTDAIFGSAWTAFDPKAYDHSVSLVTRRLEASGITSETIRGKRCFDGGCGVGRLSVALARMGAAEVVALDHSEECLDYFRKVLKDTGVANVTPVRGDATDLGAWPDQSFDFVATNGVLHHTPDCRKGLLEHMRVTRDGGQLWIYLYAQGGLYWPVFDALRGAIGPSMEASEIKARLFGLGLRPGFVYTFLDNVLAPRTYHTISEVVELLGREHTLSWREADGPSVYDNPSRTAGSPLASALLGPEGEVRMVINRLGRKARSVAPSN